jgi:uncharacterized iron-regulated protein
MRSFRFLPVLLFVAACATPPRLVTTATDTVTNAPEAAASLANADVVVLGETHETPAVHALHLDLIRELHAQRPDMVLAMEMFERDVQSPLLQYLAGVIDEGAFLAASRPWGNYARDYRPVVEFAKEKGLPVLAANAPRDLASRVAKEGIGSIAGERHAPRETSAPEDEYWDAFVEAMKDDSGAHGAHGETGTKEEQQARLHRYYEAQCLRDDTMAETVVDHRKERVADGRRPLYVLICGRQHSDYGRGAVARIKSRSPELVVRVLSTERVPDLAAGKYASPKTMADYVILVEGSPKKAAPKAGPLGKGAADPHKAPASGKPADPHKAPPAAGGNDEAPVGQRPALGLMPDYENSEGKGVLVASVREGGSAYKAGIEPGDYVVHVGGIDVTDVQSYTEALDQMVIGKTITVRIRRDDAEVALQVLVAARSR